VQTQSVGIIEPKLPIERRKDSMFKRPLLNDKVEFEESKHDKTLRSTSIYKTGDYLTPNAFESKYEDSFRRTEIAGRGKFSIDIFQQTATGAPRSLLNLPRRRLSS